MEILGLLQQMRPAVGKLTAVGFGRACAPVITALSPRYWQRLLAWGEYDNAAGAALASLGASGMRFGPLAALLEAGLKSGIDYYADLVAVSLGELNSDEQASELLRLGVSPFYLFLAASEEQIERVRLGQARAYHTLLAGELNGLSAVVLGVCPLEEIEKPLAGDFLVRPAGRDAKTGQLRVRSWGSGLLRRMPQLGQWCSRGESAPLLAISARGVQPATTEAALWLRALEGYPAIGSLGATSVGALCSGPNAIRRGPQVLAALESLGFDIVDSGQAALARAHERWLAQASALAVLSASEVLAHLPEGPLKVAKTTTVGGCKLEEGETVSLRRTWLRQRERRDKYECERGLTAFELYRQGERILSLTEADPEVSALLDAFGAPDVPVVSPARAPAPVWERLARLKLAFARRGKSLLPYQEEELLRLSQRKRVALLWEQGCGKTITAACWAAVMAASKVLVVAPAYLVPVWLEELRSWGFDARELSHATVEEARQARPQEATFWIASYEALKLTARYLEWVCEHTARNKVLASKGQEPLPPTLVRGKRCPQCRKTLGRTCPRCGAPEGVPVCRHCGYVAVKWRRSGDSSLWSCRHLSYNRLRRVGGQEALPPVQTPDETCPVCGRPRPDFRRWIEAVEIPVRAGFAPQVSAGGRVQYPLYKRVKDAFDAVIVDEAQVAKTKDTLVGQAVRSLRAPLRMLVTGTLIKSYLPDMFYNLGWLLGWNSPQWPFRYQDSRPFLESFGSYERLGEEGEFGEWKLLPEVSNLCALWSLLAPWVSRFKKADVLTLPEKRRHLVYLDLGPEQASLYSALQAHAKRHIAHVLSSDITEHDKAKAVMKPLWALRYAASCPTSAKAGWRDIETPPLPAGTAHAKLEEALRLVRKIRARGERVVVFSSLVDLLEETAQALESLGIPYRQITARTPVQERAGLVAAFNGGSEPVLLASMGALGHGVTITGANHVVIMNEEWSPEAVAQAEDRLHRIGQTRAVHVYYLLAKGTIDEDMHSLNVQKCAAQAAVLDRTPASETVEQLLSQREDVRLVLARRLLAKVSDAILAPRKARRPLAPVAAGVQLRLF